MKFRILIRIVTLICILTGCFSPPVTSNIESSPQSNSEVKASLTPVESSDEEPALTNTESPEIQASLTPTEPSDEESNENWDLVYISDSSGTGVPYVFAKYIEEDLGVEVTIHDYVIGGLPAVRVLAALRGETDGLTPGKLQKLRDVVSEAEIIVLFASYAEIEGLNEEDTGVDICALYRSGVAPETCTVDIYEPYIDILNEIYAEIFALRDGKPTIIRATNFYNPLISGWRSFNLEEECTQCWEVFNEAVEIAAEDNNIPLIDVYKAFNGENHDEDPVEKGYITYDFIHPSEEGYTVVADLLRDVGYEPVIP